MVYYTVSAKIFINMSVLDISYYLKGETIGNLDIPLSNGEIVSINLIEELPEDPHELITFLENEECPSKYWINVSQAYANLYRLDDAFLVVDKGLHHKGFNNELIDQLEKYSYWLSLKYIAMGKDKSNHMNKLREYIESVIDVDGEHDIEYLSLKAIYELYNGREEESLKYFEILLTNDETNCFAMMGKAHLLLNKANSYSLALKIYQQVLLLNPLMKPDPRLGIGLCFWFLKDIKMAIKSWERCLELDPGNLSAKIYLLLANFHHAFNYSLSDDEFKANYKNCLQTLKLIHDATPDNPVVLLVFVNYYFSKGNYDLVEKICNKIIEDNAQSKPNKFQTNLLSQSSFWLGRVYFAKGDFNQSQRYFHESSRFDDDNVLSKLGFGQSQVARGSIQEAILTFENLIKLYPKNLEVNYCLGLLYSRLKSKKKLEIAIAILEKYINLCNNRGLNALNSSNEDVTLLNKEPIILNAYLILCKLYENKDINQSLNYLNKAIESREQIGKNVPLEVYNNMGVFQFNKQNSELAIKNFKLALENLQVEQITRSDKDPEAIEILVKDLTTTLKYNLARSLEVTQQQESINIYKEILETCPNYFSAKLRLLFLDLVSTNESTKQEIKQEIIDLLEVNASNLEIRTFYSWFVKIFGKQVGLKPDADTEHQKQTLVSYNSHDTYALVSLANIYCVMARELKNNDDKAKKYYIRAIELFSKVISIDAKNVYAAQGLAVVFIENKQLDKGLDILRKIRDSLNDISIYLNLGHVLLELKQYSKAIETFEVALTRFTDGQDSNILTFLGKAWLLRGLSEKNLGYLNKALQFSQRALKVTGNHKNSLKYNVSFVQFQIADVLIKANVNERKIEDLESSIENLHEAINILKDLASDNEKHPPYPKTDLKTRANLGDTLLNRLNVSLTETKEYNEQLKDKLQEAKKIRETEIAERQELEKAKQLELQQQEEERVKERLKLQEQAQQWAEESRMAVDEGNDDKLFDEESNDKPKEKGKKKKKGRKKKDILEDSEEEKDQATDEEQHESSISPKRKAQENNGLRKKPKSNAIIEDSDEELDNDDLFGDNDENDANA